MTAVWAGIDSGKRAHHCVVIDTMGRILLSRRVVNDESSLLELIASVLALGGADQAVWATDLNAGGGALLIGGGTLDCPARPFGDSALMPGARPGSACAARRRCAPGALE
jgi:hypothetical protein